MRLNLLFSTLLLDLIFHLDNGKARLNGLVCAGTTSLDLSPQHFSCSSKFLLVLEYSWSMFATIFWLPFYLSKTGKRAQKVMATCFIYVHLLRSSSSSSSSSSTSNDGKTRPSKRFRAKSVQKNSGEIIAGLYGKKTLLTFTLWSVGPLAEARSGNSQSKT